MSTLTIVGAQWGDEGKGKVVDLLTEGANLVVRFHGGNNAGHTLVVGGVTTKLHLIPSGILRPKCRCVIGAGVVLEPSGFADETARLRAAGIDVSPARLVIDERTELVLPYHRVIDNLREVGGGSGPKIGTTGRGIGPCYEDRATRCGVRVAELRDLEALRARLVPLVELKSKYVTHVLGGTEALSFDAVWEAITIAAAEVLPFAGDGTEEILGARARGEKIVFEGAQGVLLDPVFGSVPYVTSSSTLAGAVTTGCGVGPALVGPVVGVTKAYCTRVGEGPFPTELHGALGDTIRTKGGEFGTTTGRPRRCGWLDTVLLRYAVRVSGISELVLTKLDVLSGLDEILVASAYSYNGKRYTETVPVLASELGKVTVEYKTFPGWSDDIMAARRFEDLPVAAKSYLRNISEMIGIPITLISIGPDREHTIRVCGEGKEGTSATDKFFQEAA